MKVVSKIKVLVAALAGAFAWSADAALPENVVDIPGALVITEPTTLTATNRYLDDGQTHEIRANFTLDKHSYLRLGAKNSTSTLYIGPAEGASQDANQCPIITVKGNSTFLTTYRNSQNFWDETDKTEEPTKINAVIGAHGGSGKFVVETAASGFGGNATVSLWLQKLTVSDNATTDDEFIDVLQINGSSTVFCDILTVYNENIKPVRYLFNGGRLRKNYVNDGNISSFCPSAGRTNIIEGINGHPIDIYKSFCSRPITSGSPDGVLISRGNCDFRLGSDGDTFGNNRLSYTIDPSMAKILWEHKGNFVLYNYNWLVPKGNDLLPYGPQTGGVRLEGHAILDLDGMTAHINSLTSDGKLDGSLTSVTNAAHPARTTSKLIFGAGDLNGVFNAYCAKGVNVEKEGAGTLVISNTTMDAASKLTINAGTAIIVGNCTLPTGENFVIEEGATVIREVAINVASGETTDATAYADDVDGVKLRIRKTGAGTLVLSNGASTFSGGLVIDEGIVKVTAAGAQGAGKITVNCTATKNAQIKFAGAEDATYANDIEVTGKNNLATSVTGANAAICIAQKKPILTGKITAVSDLCIADSSDIADTTAIQNYTTGTFNGEISVGGDFYCSPGGQMTFNGKITVNTYYMKTRGGCRGWLKFTKSSNKIGTISLYSDNTPKLFVDDGAATGARVVFENANTASQADIRGIFEAQNNLSIASLEGPAFCRTAEDSTKAGYGILCNAAKTMTLTITGREDVDSTLFCGGVGRSSDSGTWTRSVVLNAREGFTQVFSNVFYVANQELKVSSGTLLIAGKSYFPNLTKITVEGTGVLDIQGLGAVSGDSKGFSMLTNISIASTAKIKLAEGIELTAATVKVDGFQLNADTYSTGYSAATLPWIEGAGTIKATTSPTPPVTAKDAVWSGAGADTLTTTAANWTNNLPPAFYYWGYCPCFGEGGSRADFPSGTQLLNGLSVYREGGFTIGGAADTVLALAPSKVPTIAKGRNGEGPENTEETFTFEVPVAVSNAAVADADFWVPTHKTVRFSGGLRSTNLNIKQKGTGTVEFVDSPFSGDYYHQDGGYMRITGEFGAENDTRVFFVNDAANDHTYLDDKGNKAYYCVKVGDLTLDNAVIRKETRIGSVGQVNGRALDTYDWLHTTEGSTNVFTKIVKQTASMRLELDSNTTLIFEKGYSDTSTTSGGSFNPDMKSGCTNSTMVFNGPINLFKPDKGTFSANRKGLTIVLGASSNVVVKSFTLNNYKVVCKADDAFVGVKRAIVTGGETTLDLTTTYQRAEDFYVHNGNGVITGEYPATIDFTSVTNETFAKDGNHNFCPQILSGWVKLAMSGTGYQIVGQNGKGFASQSYGDIEVSNGTLELMPQTTWLNGTNFIAKGEGKLKLSATNNKPQVGPQAVFHFAENGKVEIPSGVTVSVSAAFVEGAQVGAGTYSAATAAGPMVGRITGEGRLRVRSGMMLILR